jgi:protein SMG8
MRIHVVTPKAPVLVTLRPRVDPGSGTDLLYFPTDQSVKLAPASYWVLRLPFVYQCESTSTEQRIYSKNREAARFLANCFGISDQLNDSHIEYISGYTQNST